MALPLDWAQPLEIQLWSEVNSVMMLEQAISGAVMRARTAERALHDRRPWTMEAAGRRVPCRRVLGDDRIVFLGYLTEPLGATGRVVLRCGEDVVDVADVQCDRADTGWTELRHEIVVAAL